MRDRHRWYRRLSNYLPAPTSARASPAISRARAQRACALPSAQSAQHSGGAARAATSTRRRIGRRGCWRRCAVRGAAIASPRRAPPPWRQSTRSTFRARVLASADTMGSSRRRLRISGTSRRALGRWSAQHRRPVRAARASACSFSIRLRCSPHAAGTMAAAAGCTVRDLSSWRSSG